MWWFLFCLIGLVASKPYPGNIQKRGLSCFFTRPPPAELPSININPTDIINTPGNFFDEHYTPTIQEVPLVNWAGSGPGHTLQYRAWRFHRNNTAPDNFHVQVEFQITAPLNAMITFGANSARQPGDPGFGMQTQGLAEVASTSRFPRRWSLELMIPRRHLNVQYWISGSWRNV